jgi:hypothetical protein
MRIDNASQEKGMAMIHMGIDLHKRYSYVVALDDAGQVLDEHRLNND